MSDQATAAPAAPPTRPPWQPSPTAEFVGQQIRVLQEQYVGARQPTPYSRAALARLRRGLGAPLGAVPEILDLVIDPEGRGPTSEAATAGEIAAATALTLYALHQQSQRQRMHLRARSFGAAVGSLRRLPSGDDNEGVLRRFQALGTASSMDELVHHARGLVTLLRSEERGFDYVAFTDDLIRFQDPRRRDAVRLTWGRDFYRLPTSSPTDPTEPAAAISEEQS